MLALSPRLSLHATSVSRPRRTLPVLLARNSAADEAGATEAGPPAVAEGEEQASAAARDEEEEDEIEGDDAEADVADEAEPLLPSPPPPPRTLVSTAASVAAQPAVKAVLVGTGAVLVGTLAFAVYKVWLRFNSAYAKRRRQIARNAAVVETLSGYLPARRGALSSTAIRALALRTGFSADALFRKHLRYMLAERPFDGECVADVAALRAACRLSDAQFAEVLREAAERTVKKTGLLMRRPAGMTAEGLARKAQNRAAFAKLLWLAESEAMLAKPEEREAARSTLRSVFGATEEDTDALRIPSLLDVGALERLWAETTGPDKAQ